MSNDPTIELWEQELRHGHYRLRAPSGSQEGAAQGAASRATEVEGMLLGSRFTPVWSRAHDRPVGHRPQLHFLDEPWRQDGAAGQAELLRRDRSGRAEALAPGLHMTNYHATVADRGWLFLSVPPQVLGHSSLWPPLPQDLFSSTLFAPKDIVLGVSVDSASIGQIEDFARYHQALGFMVALTDFGRRHADLKAVWQVRPDLVVMPLRGLGEVTPGGAGRAASALCRVLHESGVMVALAGVDSPADLAQALLTDTDLLEGEYAGNRPVQSGGQVSASARQEPRATLEASLDAIVNGGTFESACERLLNEEGVLRCYLLDGDGTQIADNLSPVGVRSDPRYWPLANAIGASWSHRDYFKSAMAHPGQVMRTGPYFSLPDGRHCLTLSMARHGTDHSLVLCCDLSEVQAVDMPPPTSTSD